MLIVRYMIWSDSGDPVCASAAAVTGGHENDGKRWLRNESDTLAEVYAPQEYLDCYSEH